MLSQRFRFLGFPALMLVLFFVAPQTFAQDQPAAEAPPADASADAKSDKLFPDPGLEAAVRAEVFAKRYNEERLTVDDVRNISRVVGVGKEIKNLEGLQHCTAVMLVDLSDNQITDLSPLAGLNKLQSITLAKNTIKDIKPLEGLTAVQLLDLSNNEVESLEAVQKMTNLRSLWVADNQLKSLEPIGQLEKIWSLDVAGNGLADIAPVGKLKWLTNLDLDRNVVETLESLKPLTELDILLVRENKLTDLSPLVEMCRSDADGEKRFAPYLRVYLKGNPLSEQAKTEQLDALKNIGVRVLME